MLQQLKQEKQLLNADKLHLKQLQSHKTQVLWVKHDLG